MSGRLTNIYVCRKKGYTREEVSQADLDENKGLIGDYKSESGDKDIQILILLKRDRESIDTNYSNRGLCTMRFQENILIEGFDLHQLNASTRVKIGQAIVEITSVGKRCFEECELVRSKELCPLKEGVLSAKVIKGGPISVGDTIVKDNI